MNARKTVKKILALGAGATMVGATIMGAAAYNLAEYPAPFVMDGMANAKIVVGARAATQDVLGAIDIAASLQAAAVSKTAVDIPGAAGEVMLEGDAFKFETGNDMLEIREAMGNVFDSLTDAELPALRGGTITTDEGSTDYDQYLNLDDGAGTSLQAIGVNFAEDKQDEIGDFLIIDNDLSFFEWEIVFNEGLESDIDSTNYDLPDLEDEIFNIFGTDYTFVNSDVNNNGAGPQVVLEFMAGDVSSTMREGETKTFTIDGVEYEVTLIFVSDPSSGNAGNEAKFMVNGEVTDSLADGDTDILSGGLQIGVRDLLVNSREGVVEFFLGAEKISFTDPDVTDNAYTSGSQIEVGNEEIDDAEVRIDATITGTTSIEISGMRYRLEANPSDGSVFYIPPGSGVREFMLEPEALLSPTFDIRYEGLKDVPKTMISIGTSGDDQYEITVTNNQNKEFEWPFFNAEDQDVRFGEEDDSFVFVEAGFDALEGDTTAGSISAIATALNDTAGTANETLLNATYNIWQDDYFLVSDVAKEEKANSYVLTYDSISTSENTITFSDLDGGRYTVQFTAFDGGVEADGGPLGYSDKLRVGGNTFNVWIKNDEDNDYPVAIDLNNDGVLGDASRAFFTVKGGGILDFAASITADGTPLASTAFETVVGHALDIDGDNNAANDKVTMRLTTLDSEFDTSNDGNETVEWNLTAATDDEVDISLRAADISEPTYLSGLSKYDEINFLDEDSGDVSRTITSYGAHIMLDEPSSSPATFDIEYPMSQVGAQVFVVAGETVRSETVAGVSADKVNPIAVGLAVLDSAAPAIGSTNMIVVGGPCANTVAMSLRGNPAQCGEGFVEGKAMLKSYERNGKVALLVAGYGAEDTLGASYVLANYGDYTLSGEEAEVVVADLNSITVNTVA